MRAVALAGAAEAAAAAAEAAEASAATHSAGVIEEITGTIPVTGRTANATAVAAAMWWRQSKSSSNQAPWPRSAPRSPRARTLDPPRLWRASSAAADAIAEIGVAGRALNGAWAINGDAEKGGETSDGADSSSDGDGSSSPPTSVAMEQAAAMVRVASTARNALACPMQ